MQPAKKDKQARQDGLSVDLASLIGFKSTDDTELEDMTTGQNKEIGLGIHWTGKVSIDL